MPFACARKRIPFSIAIDGPAAAGKTTQAKILARKLGITYVDTGAMYRAIAVAVHESGRDVLDVIQDVVISVARTEDGGQAMLVNGIDVTHKLRTPEISMLASTVSKQKEVRAFLLDLQRDMATNGDVVMEGRDIGTVILPHASVKIYLTADLDVRAKRRMKDLGLDEISQADFEIIRDDMHARDVQDMTRAEAPLKQAEDATLVDNTALTVEETTAAILDVCQKSRGL